MVHAVPTTLALCMVTWGWGAGHAVVRRLALSALPAWQHEMLEEAAEALCTDYTSLQDKHAGGNRPDLDPYCVVPEVALSLHDVNPILPTLTGMEWYLVRIGEELRAGNTDEAAKYLGVLCHWFEDPGSPTMHCVQGVTDEYRLRELLPPPPDKRKYHYLYGYAGIADNGNYELPEEEVQPRLLGATVAEAAWHMQQRQRSNARLARAAIIPIVQDEMYGDGSKAARERGRLLVENARTTADVVYTALCLAANRVDEEEAAALSEVPLADLVPDYHGGATGAPYKWVPFLVDASFDEKRNVLPLQLPGGDDAESVEHGLGMGTPFALTYVFGSGDVYSRFTCKVGLHPSAGHGGSVRFLVRVNDEAQASIGPLAAGRPAEVVTVSLPDTDTVKLTLVTEPGPESIESDNLAVWAEPTLHRE